MFRSAVESTRIPLNRRVDLETAWLVLGTLLLLIVFVDALWTALWVDGGGGFLTARMTTWAWRGVMAAAGRRHHRSMSLFGPVVLIGVVGFWGLLLWGSWVLIFASDPRALLGTGPSGESAGWAGRIWFVAYAISTMGNGDYVPNGDAWQIVASLTTLSGFFLASLVISYLISVLTAVVAKRAFAAQVTGLGPVPSELLKNTWDGESFRTLDLPLSSVSAMLGPLTEQYLSYPILQYYHAARAEKSPAMGIVLLDETLTILQHGIPERSRPTVAVLHSARAGVSGYLETLQSAFIDPAEEAPPGPDLDRLREAGIPTLSDGEFQEALEALKERRKKLRGLLLANGWNWPEW